MIWTGLDQSKRDAAVFVLCCVQKDRRWFTDVCNDHVDTPVIIEVAEGGSATGTKRKLAQAGLLGDLFERAVTEITVEQKVLQKSHLSAALCQFDLRINVAIHDKKIWPAVIIKVNKTGSPTHIWQADRTDFRFRRDVKKTLRTEISIERVVFVVEIGDEKIELSIAIIVTPGYAHRALLNARTTIGRA